MKKLTIVVIAFSLAVSLFSLAHAGMGGGCGNCAQNGGAGGTGAQSDPYRKFQADTLDLRQEMMTKRFEVQRENLKGTPDQAKIAALQADIKGIQAKIQEMRTQSGLPNDKCDGECRTNFNCDKKSAGCGKGMGGCGKGAPCGQK
jgi:hypothetical protein